MKKRVSDMSHAWYTPERDGDLRTHLENFGYGSSVLFKGFEQYKMLWEQGFLEPYISSIRLMWGQGGDEAFIVRDLHEIEGCDDVLVHKARSGIHDPEKVLEEKNVDKPILFEAHYLSRNPVPRIPKKKVC